MFELEYLSKGNSTFDDISRGRYKGTIHINLNYVLTISLNETWEVYGKHIFYSIVKVKDDSVYYVKPEVAQKILEALNKND